MTADEPGDLLVADSGRTDDTFNIISYARFAPADADRRVASTGDALARTGRPYSWWVGPASTPAELSARLSAVCTLTAWRERGHATHLTRAAMSLARETGFDRAVSQASEDGARVQARLDFEPVGEFVEHRLGG